MTTTAPLENQPTAAPTPKLVAGTLAGSATTVLLYVAEQTDIELPLPVAGAIIVLASAVVAYFKRNRAPKHAA